VRLQKLKVGYTKLIIFYIWKEDCKSHKSPRN